MPGSLPAIIVLIVVTLVVGALAIYANVAGCRASGHGARRCGRRQQGGEAAESRPEKRSENQASGSYACACCGNLLFISTARVAESGGLPCFRTPLTGAVTEITDISDGRLRTEFICSGCEAHLGYLVAGDARYRIDSPALEFVS